MSQDTGLLCKALAKKQKRNFKKTKPKKSRKLKRKNKGILNLAASNPGIGTKFNLK